MSDRITVEQLKSRIRYINEATGQPTEPYKCDEDGHLVRGEGGRLVHQPGNYHLDRAYGGSQLAQVCESGGTRNVLHSGYVGNRALYDLLWAFLMGITAGAQASVPMEDAS